MSSRLKNIWAGFEETTSRHLTGGGVDNIAVPHRVDYTAEDESLLPEGFDAPPKRRSRRCAKSSTVRKRNSGARPGNLAARAKPAP